MRQRYGLKPWFRYRRMKGTGQSASGILAVFLVGLAILPQAAAIDSAGSLRLESPITLPGGSQVQSASALAVYAGDTCTANLSIMAPVMRVHRYEQRLVSIPGVLAKETQIEGRTWTLTNVTIKSKPNAENCGFLGIYPAWDAVVDTATSSPADIESRQASTIPPGEQATRDGPDVPDYTRQIDQPHLYSSAPGLVQYVGGSEPSAVKLRGLDVTITAAENTTQWETGNEEPSAVELVRRWLYLEFNAGSVSLSASAPIEVALSQATVAWDGEAWMRPMAGRLLTDEAEYQPSGDGARVALDGNFKGRLVPALGPADALDLTIFQGEVRSTGLVRHERAPAPLLPASWEPFRGWIPWMLVGFVAVTGGAAVLVVRRRKVAALVVSTVQADETREAEAFFGYYVMLSGERHQDALALEWVKAARDDGLATAEVSLWEATIYRNLGDDKRALQLYEEASFLDPHEADADFWAAALLIQRGTWADVDRAFMHVRRVLERKPEWAATIEDDPIFSALPAHDLKTLLDEAEQRWQSRSGGGVI